MAASNDPPEAADQRKSPINLLDLPIETIGLICENVYFHDLPQLCRVSRAMREFAAAELYRSLNHTFGPSRPRRQGLQVDDLAGYLETLATSEYNYAGHIKEAYFDTTSAGESGERLCREFSYDHSCGKFLQTLLLAVLKRTTGLESFYWNTRIELSTAVYRTLYKMPHLRRVHVRLQVGPSLHSTSNTANATALTVSPPPNVMPPPPGHPPHVPQAHNGYNQYPQVTASHALVKKAPVARQVLRATTFSEFKELNSLSVLDMDTLENVPEIAACLNKSSDTLKHLCLSLSDRFARKARKATATESVSDNTVTEDDVSETNTVPPPPLNVDGSENTAGLPILPDTPQSYRVAQEGALARIFEFSKNASTTRELRKAVENTITQADREQNAGLSSTKQGHNDEHFIKMLKSILLEKPDDSNSEEASKKAFYDKLDKAASGYLKTRDTRRDPPKRKKLAKAVKKPPKPYVSQPVYIPPPTQPASGSVYSFVPITKAESNSSPSSSEHSGWGNPTYSDYSPKPLYHYPKPVNNSIPFTPIHVPHQPEASSSPKPVTFSSFVPVSASNALATFQPSANKASSIGSKSNSGGAATPPAMASGSSSGSVNGAAEPAQLPDQEIFDDDVDLEHPDEIGDEENGEDQAFVNGTVDEGIEVTETGQNKLLGSRDETLPSSVPEGLSNGEEPTPSANAKGKQVVRAPPNGVLPPLAGEEDSAATYLRLSHGITLESLAIYLLPVKPSVLLRHVDMQSLKFLCLLNVGPQRTLWVTLTKLHRQSPLQLSSVYTDDVTQSLLGFLNALPTGQLEELALLEHGPRAKVPQLAGCGKTQVDAHEITKTVLKKHMKGLKRLVIRNDDDDKWAIDSATVRLMAREGQKLEELGVQCYSNVFHTLARSLPALTRLYALQVVFIVDTPPQSVPMNSSHAQPIGPNYPSALPPIIHNTVLEELRHSIIDNLSHCNTVDFELTYIGLAAVNGNAQSGVGLGPPAVVLSRVGRDWEILTDGEDDTDADAESVAGSEKGEIKEKNTTGESSNGERERGVEVDTGSSSTAAAAAAAAAKTTTTATTEKKDTSTEKRELVVWTEDNLKMAEVQGVVKMWGKELWSGRL